MTQNILDTRSPEERKTNDLGGKIGDSIAAGFVLAVGISLWLIGGYLMLLALNAIGLPIKEMKGFAWLIPLGISAVELRFWPKPTTLWSYRTLMLLAIGLPDLASTFFGSWEYLRGRSVPLFTGFTIPEGGRTLMVLCSISSIILSFSPERLSIHALKDLMRIWGVKKFLFITAEVAR